MGIENTCVKMFCVILAQSTEFKLVFNAVSWLVQGIVSSNRKAPISEVFKFIYATVSNDTHRWHTDIDYLNQTILRTTWMKLPICFLLLH